MLKVTVRAELVVPWYWLPKVKLLEEKLATEEIPTPVPVRVIACEPLPALSLMLTAAERFPAEAGVIVTLIVQLPPAATEVPHVLVWAKSPGLAPVKPILLTKFNTALPVLVRVTDCAALVVPRFWLAKTRLEAFRLTAGPPPVPERLMVCGLPTALSEMFTVAVRLPVAEGVKVTLIVQLPPTARVPTQVEV